MFWKKKDKKKSEEDAAEKSARLREEAMVNARAARVRIGEETLDRVAAAMIKKQQTEMEKARTKLKTADSNKLADEIRWMLGDKD